MPNRTGSAFELIERIMSINEGAIPLVIAQTDEEFEQAFEKWLDRAVHDLETKKKDFKSLGEDGLSSALASALSSYPLVTATRETNCNGHVDLTVEVGFGVRLRRKLGEAKIYSGYAYHCAGLEQLLGRYTTGREGRGLLIEYVRKPNVKGLMGNLRKEMDEQLPCNQKGSASDHFIQWSFSSIHGHSSGEDLGVDHIGCNMYVGDGQDA
jgi:hypothetical protein